MRRASKVASSHRCFPIEVSLDGNGHHEIFTQDEGIRANANYEATAALQPAFNPEHSITAGNSSQISMERRRCC